MIAQDPIDKYYVYEGMPVTARFFTASRLYKCCFWRCRCSDVDVRIDGDSRLRLYHTSCSKKSQGPLRHDLHTKYYKEICEAIRHCFYVHARCPTCSIVTSRKQLIRKPRIYIFNGRVVFDMPKLRVIVTFFSAPKNEMPLEIPTLLGKAPRTLQYTLAQLRKPCFVDYHPMGKRYCSQHKALPCFPIFIFTQQCVQCRCKHGMIHIQDDTHKRIIPRTYTSDHRDQRTRIQVWCCMPPNMRTTPYCPHRHAKDYPVEERPYWYCYVQDSTDLSKLDWFEEEVFQGVKLNHLVRQKKLSWKDDCILETPTLTKTLCEKCIERNKPIVPCCKLCNATDVVLQHNTCLECSEIFFLCPPEIKALKEIAEPYYPESTTVNEDIPTDTIAAVNLATRQRLVPDASLDLDDMVRCYNCSTIHTLRSMEPFEADERRHLDIADIPTYTIYYCINCVKKCKLCNTLLKLSDPMSKCERCRLARHNRLHQTPEQFNPRLQYYTIPGSLLS